MRCECLRAIVTRSPLVASVGLPAADLAALILDVKQDSSADSAEAGLAARNQIPPTKNPSSRTLSCHLLNGRVSPPPLLRCLTFPTLVNRLGGLFE